MYGDRTGEEEHESAERRNKYLLSLWANPRYVGVRDAYQDMKFNFVVKGKAAVQVSWIRDITPKALRWHRPPVLFRTIDPCEVGVISSDMGTEAAYRTFNVSVGKLLLDYPEAKKSKTLKEKDSTDVVTFTDFWGMDKNGEVYNAFLLNDSEFLVKPRRSKSPIIPIIVRGANDNPVDMESMKSPSILQSSISEWQNECMLESMILSGTARNFWPIMVATDDAGDPIPDMTNAPGDIQEVSRTFRWVDTPQPRPDFQSAASTSDRVATRIERTSFSRELYGAGGTARSGFLFNSVVQAGTARMGRIIKSLERMISECSAIALCLTKTFAGEEIATFSYDAKNKTLNKESIAPEDIADSYENTVILNPAAATSDDMQKLALCIQLKDRKILSAGTIRDRLVPFSLPDNEDEIIMVEEALNDPDVVKERIRQAYREYYGVELPPGEPDFQKTPPQAAAGPGSPPSLQPPQAFPGMPLPPEQQGQISPEAMTGNAEINPEMLQMLMSGGPTNGM